MTLRNVSVQNWDGKTLTKRLSVRLPVGLARHVLKTAQQTGRIQFTANRHGEFTLMAGTGKNAVIIDRGDHVRVQLGVGKGASSHWIGRTAVGNLVPGGKGTFVGRSGASQTGATLLNGQTLQADPNGHLDGNTKRWWASRGRPVFDHQRLHRTFAGSQDITIRQIASSLGAADNATLEELFAGIRTVPKKVREQVGRPAQHPRTIAARNNARRNPVQVMRVDASAAKRLAAFDATLKYPARDEQPVFVKYDAKWWSTPGPNGF